MLEQPTDCRSDIYIICGDEGLREWLQRQFSGRQLSARGFDASNEALDNLKIHQPKVLVLEWSIADMSAVDFLIRISENKSWGEMRVIFVSEHEVSESEALHMATLGVEECYWRQDLSGGELRDFIEVVSASLEIPKS